MSGVKRWWLPGLCVLALALVVAMIFSSGDESAWDYVVMEDVSNDDEPAGEYIATYEKEVLFYKHGFTLEAVGNVLRMSNDAAVIVYDLETGLFDVYRFGSYYANFRGVFAETVIDGIRITSHALNREEGFLSIETITDVFGEGVRVSIINSGNPVSILQNFIFHPTRDFIMLDAVVLGSGIRSNFVAPIAAGDYELDMTEVHDDVMLLVDAVDPRFLFVPFDNDMFVRFNSFPLLGASVSYSVTAVFDNYTRHGFVIGALTHCTWKTAIHVRHGRFNRLINLRVFGGASSFQTRDFLPHGYVYGDEIASPLMFVGFFDDWRNGLETFGRAVGTITPPLPWDDGVPFGWNSWSAVADRVCFDVYVGASDFFRDYLQPNSFHNNGVVYIIFDSFWDNLTVAQKRAAAQHVRDNGQRPGIYFTPFSYWDTWNTARTVAGTGGQFSYHDILLRCFDGNYLPVFNVGRSIDPTHPGQLKRVEHWMGQFLDWGFEYIKFDFLSHGSTEGNFYNPYITTGIQAYNFGMQHIIDFLGDKITNQEFFISLSIAPIFPGGQFSHGRRISCDVFGTIDNAEYMLNSLTYGWWLHDAVYTFNDPDHIVVFNSYNHRSAILFNEGLTRYISSAIAGTFMINSDDFRQRAARERAMEILTNERVNQMAAQGITFRPVEGNTGNRAADLFVRHDVEKQVLYFAVFNFSRYERKNMQVDIGRLGLDPTREYEALCMISGETVTIPVGTFRIRLEPAEPGLFRIEYGR